MRTIICFQNKLSVALLITFDTPHTSHSHTAPGIAQCDVCLLPTARPPEEETVHLERPSYQAAPSLLSGTGGGTGITNKQTLGTTERNVIGTPARGWEEGKEAEEEEEEEVEEEVGEGLFKANAVN